MKDGEVVKRTVKDSVFTNLFGDSMMQLYDQEEIMKVYVRGERKNAAIQTTVEVCQDFGASFLETVNKVAQKFSMSHETAEEEVREYWQD